jgi:hypothetical protein
MRVSKPERTIVRPHDRHAIQVILASGTIAAAPQRAEVDIGRRALLAYRGDDPVPAGRLPPIEEGAVLHTARGTLQDLRKGAAGCPGSTACSAPIVLRDNLHWDKALFDQGLPRRAVGDAPLGALALDPRAAWGRAKDCFPQELRDRIEAVLIGLGALELPGIRSSARGLRRSIRASRSRKKDEEGDE